MPILLLIESSTEVCSVCLAKDGIILSHCESDAANSHTEQLTLLIQSCLLTAKLNIKEIDAVAISDGPGSYTSLRVGAATAKGICYAIQKPLIVIDSLETLAYGIDAKQLNADDIIIAMIDARRMEVYASVFDYEINRLTGPESVILDNESFAGFFESNNIFLCGNGASKYHQHFKQEKHILNHNRTSAQYMIVPALKKYENQQFEDIAYYTPNYLKAPNITKSNKKLF